MLNAGSIASKGVCTRDLKFQFRARKSGQWQAVLRMFAGFARTHLKGHAQSDLSVRTLATLAATGWRGSADLLA